MSKKRIGEIKHEIWSDFSCSPYWKDIEDSVREDLAEEIEPDIYDTVMEYVEMDIDEIRLNNTEPIGDIIALGDLGLWNGRASGYRYTGKSIADCFSSWEGYAEFYIDKCNDLRLIDRHHDGTNYILFRKFKDDLSWEQRNNFSSKVMTGKATRADIRRYTEAIGNRVLWYGNGYYIG